MPPDGKYAKAAIIHDYLYDNALRTKKEADLIFLDGMTVLGVPKWKRIVMYLAVRWFGGGMYGKERKYCEWFATDDEIKRLEAWELYSVMVNRVDTSAPPGRINQPVCSRYCGTLIIYVSQITCLQGN